MFRLFIIFSLLLVLPAKPLLAEDDPVEGVEGPEVDAPQSDKPSSRSAQRPQHQTEEKTGKQKRETTKPRTFPIGLYDLANRSLSEVPFKSEKEKPSEKQQREIRVLDIFKSVKEFLKVKKDADVAELNEAARLFVDHLGVLGLLKEKHLLPKPDGGIDNAAIQFILDRLCLTLKDLGKAKIEALRRALGEIFKAGGGGFKYSAGGSSPAIPPGSESKAQTTSDSTSIPSFGSSPAQPQGFTNIDAPKSKDKDSGSPAQASLTDPNKKLSEFKMGEDWCQIDDENDPNKKPHKPKPNKPPGGGGGPNGGGGGNMNPGGPPPPPPEEEASQNNFPQPGGPGYQPSLSKLAPPNMPEVYDLSEMPPSVVPTEADLTGQIGQFKYTPGDQPVKDFSIFNNNNSLMLNGGAVDPSQDMGAGGQ